MKVIVNFYWFLYRLIKHRKDVSIFTTQDVIDKRMSICNSCELINRKGVLVKLKGNRCGECGCFLHYKTQFEFEECPKEKW